MKYVVARALKTGSIGLADFADSVLHDPEVRQMMDKTTVGVSGDIEALTPSAWPCRLTVELSDGRVVNEFVKYPKGDPENSLAWDEVKEKFNLLVEGILPQSAANEVIAICEDITGLHDCGQLIQVVNQNGKFGN